MENVWIRWHDQKFSNSPAIIQGIEIPGKEEEKEGKESDKSKYDGSCKLVFDFAKN